MSFRLRVKYYLVHKLNYAGKKADQLILSGRITINGKAINTNEFLSDTDEVCMDNQRLRPGLKYEYYLLNKPVGVECTFNPKIKDNLTGIFPLEGTYFVAGRLDKASEGLLLISNDGKWVNKISHPESGKEKEYLVRVDKEINAEFIDKMSSGVDIGSHITKPCSVTAIGKNEFRIILTEGKNRQIRRMCKRLRFVVTGLRRIRIDTFYLADLDGIAYKKLIL